MTATTGSEGQGAASTGADGDIKNRFANWETNEEHPVHHAATIRNRVPIWENLQQIFQERYWGAGKEGISVLELASGTGAHVEYFAGKDRRVWWQQTDYKLSTVPLDEENVAKPVELDLIKVADEADSEGSEGYMEGMLKKLEEGKRDFNVVYTCNLCHIAPIECTENIFKHVIPGLEKGQGGKGVDLLVIYGPFRTDEEGSNLTEDDWEFDKGLKEKDPGYGIRNMRDLEKLAEQWTGMELKETREMPKGNFLLVFGKK